MALLGLVATASSAAADDRALPSHTIGRPAYTDTLVGELSTPAPDFRARLLAHLAALPEFALTDAVRLAIIAHELPAAEAALDRWRDFSPALPAHHLVRAELHLARADWAAARMELRATCDPYPEDYAWWCYELDGAVRTRATTAPAIDRLVKRGRDSVRERQKANAVALGLEQVVVECSHHGERHQIVAVSWRKGRYRTREDGALGSCVAAALIAYGVERPPAHLETPVEIRIDDRRVPLRSAVANGWLIGLYDRERIGFSGSRGLAIRGTAEPVRSVFGSMVVGLDMTIGSAESSLDFAGRSLLGYAYAFPGGTLLGVSAGFGVQKETDTIAFELPLEVRARIPLDHAAAYLWLRVTRLADHYAPQLGMATSLPIGPGIYAGATIEERNGVLEATAVLAIPFGTVF